MCQAIAAGCVPPNLKDIAPNNVSHGRWLTTANHILHTYVGTEKPSKNLLEFVKYIMKVSLCFNILKFIYEFSALYLIIFTYLF